MKKTLFLSLLLFNALLMVAQKYPEPEFANEVYYLNKNNGNTLVRLEKNASKMDQKNNVVSGSEVGYSMDGTKSSVRLTDGSGLSFVFSTGASSNNSSSSSSSSSSSDSMMRANGVDPSMINGMGGMGGMTDPSNRLTLYKVDIEKGERKVLLQKAPGMNPFGKHKIQSSDKYTFSAKKIRDGYWELLVDKPLPKGEYAFTMQDTGVSAMGMGTVLFAFGID